MAEQVQRSVWIYVWFGVSALLNLSGMASIADGFVTWAKFFHDIIDVYRAVIRQPLAWIGHLIWPFGPIPVWVFDIVVFWSGLFLAVNVSLYKTSGKTFFSIWSDIPVLMRSIPIDTPAEKWIFAFSVILTTLMTAVIMPALMMYLCYWLFMGLFNPDHRRETLDTLLNFLFFIAIFILLLFINWQVRQHTAELKVEQPPSPRVTSVPKTPAAPQLGASPGAR